MCYACICGLDDSKPSEKSKGTCFFLNSCVSLNVERIKGKVETECLTVYMPCLLQLMHADPHKLDFRSDPLARLPGAGGLGPMGPMGGAMPPTHDLTRPPSLFSASGACLNNS